MIKLEKSDEVAWDDPRGWGFCEGCAFQVPTDIITGILVEHFRSIGSSDHRCDGSGRHPTPQPDHEAHPNNTVGWKQLKPQPVVHYGMEALHGPEPETPGVD